MSVKLACSDCEWWVECDPDETPFFCPECGGRVKAGVTFTDIDPEEKKSNEI